MTRPYGGDLWEDGEEGKDDMTYLSQEYGEVKRYADSQSFAKSARKVWGCDGHSPRHVIHGEGWDVWAGTRRHVLGAVKDYDLVLNLSGSGVAERHHIPLPGFERWERYAGGVTEIELDWPDYGVVTLPVEFWKQLIAYLTEHKARMLVFCVGGHGRTGTAVASLLTAAGWDSDAAIKWVRENYCRKAVETLGQENYVRALAGKPPKPSKAVSRPLFSEEPLEAPSAFERETRATHRHGMPWPRCARCDHSQKRHYGIQGCHATSCDCPEFVAGLPEAVGDDALLASTSSELASEPASGKGE